MELSGDEKRIQALFCELSLEDRSAAPDFEKLWQRAQTTPPARVRGPNRSLAAITAAVVIAASCSLALWLWYRAAQSPTRQDVENVLAATRAAAPPVQKPAKLFSVNPPRLHPGREKRLVRQQPAKGTLTRDAAMLSRWQSPTGILMQSSAGFVLKSLPQLNQSAKDLESFLWKNNQVMKESNQ